MTTTLLLSVLSLLLITAIAATAQSVRHGGYRHSRSPLRHVENDWAAGGLPVDSYSRDAFSRLH